MNHTPDEDLAEEGQLIVKSEKETYQHSCHITNYQKKWMDKVNEEDSFNFSDFVRRVMDSYIANHHIDLPEDVVVDKSEAKVNNEPEGIEVYITDD